MEFFKGLIKSELIFVNKLADICPIKQSRTAMEKMGKLLKRRYESNAAYRKIHFPDFDAEFIVPSEVKRGKLILYLHGGGYVLGGIDYARGFGTMLSSRCGISVCYPVYRTAPEHPFPSALSDAYDTYRYLLQNGYSAKDIILCGESAGGGLVYALLLKLKEENCLMPCGTVSISPWTDLTLSGESFIKNYNKDPSLTKRRLISYRHAYTDDFESPYVSPIFGDLTGIPPSLILVGGNEILLSDATALHQKLISCKCDSLLHIEPGMWHVYPMYNISESDGAFNIMCDFLEDLDNEKK